MNHLFTFILLLICLFPLKSKAQLTVNGYTNYTLSGFNVLVENDAFTNNSVLTNEAIDLLEINLIEISHFNIDPVKLDSLKVVPIFMDWNTTTGAAQYHPSESWLIANSYIPEKARCVEISNITNFINWTNQNQPYMVLHELSHAYHHRVLNFNDPTITNAFNNAVSNNLYTNVSYHIGGGNYINQASAYALTNEKEFFAEITEAYFGLNDYFPFDYNDLNNYDLVGFNAAVFVWGDLCFTATIGTDTRTECNSYTWIDGNNYTSSNNTASFNIVGGSANGCDSIVTIDLTVNNVTNITTSVSGQTIIAANGNATHQWLDCDNNNAIITGETGQSYTATVNGNYAVELTENGCIDTSACVAITTVGIIESSFGNDLNIYPNPTIGNFSIDLGINYKSTVVTLTDLNGKLIQSKQYINSGLLNLKIDKPAGVYLLIIESENKKAVIRLVKE